MSIGIQYRPEIDGLRAIAVLAVLIFHAKLGLLPGGFVGVDVFFVISGYLIASIILNAEKKGEFSLIQFYERRIRRIFPALFVVVISCLVIGYFYFPPKDYNTLAGSAQAAMAFYSNLFFARTIGYFQPTAESQLLLHTWSLGVEEQFYLIAPFLLLLLQRKLYRYRVAIIGVLFFASLATSLHGIYISSVRVFYMPHARAFELLVGVALAMGFLPAFQRKVFNEALSVLGMAMILAALLLFNSQSPFPGFLALLPTFGTALIIHASTTNQTAIGKILSAKPCVSIGKISYSLYLWHWPLLAFGDYELGHQITSTHRLVLLALAFVLATLTYLYVEQPARRASAVFGRKHVFASGFAAIFICAVAAQVILFTRGLPQRLSPNIQALEREIQNPDPIQVCYPDTQKRPVEKARICTFGSETAAAPSFMLIGDSHANALVSVLTEFAKAEGQKGYNFAANGCPPFFGLNNHTSPSKACLSALEQVEQYVKESSLKDVIIAARWAYYAEGGGLPSELLRRQWQIASNDARGNRAIFDLLFMQSMERLISMGKRITIIGPAPEMDVIVPMMLLKNAMRKIETDISNPRTIFEDRQKFVLPVLQRFDHKQGITIIYPHSKLCDAVNCFGSKGRSAYYFDDDHLSNQGARLMSDEFRQVFINMRR